MTYALTLRPLDARIGRIEIQAYLAMRAGYTLEGSTLAYVNGDTGVDFQLVADEDAHGPRVQFALEYLRPRVFALEAALELATLAREVGLTVHDSPEHGSAERAFEVERMVREWEAGNAAACAIALSHGHEPPSMPRAMMEAHWRWNLERGAYERALQSADAGAYVPRVFLLDQLAGPANEPLEPTVRTAVLWPEGWPVILPDVDVVLLCDNQRAAKQFHTLESQRLAELVAGFEGYPQGHEFEIDGERFHTALAHRDLGDASRAAEVFERAWTGSLPCIPSFHRISSVLERETLDAVRSAGIEPG